MKEWLEADDPSRPLDLYELRLTSLPALPDSVQNLNVSGNHLMYLPKKLPSSLQVLWAADNLLISLPETLPPSLQVLYVFDNHLISLPKKLPPSLRELYVFGNQLTSLPEDIATTLDKDCRVHLENNPLPAEVTRNLHAIISAPDYQGPSFVFFMTTAAHAASAPPLEDAVSDCPGEGNDEDVRAARSSFARSPEPANHSVNQPGSTSNPPEEGSSMHIEPGSSEPGIAQRSSQQTAPLTQVPSRPKSKEEYFAEWAAWTQQPNQGPEENRAEAVSRMKEWLEADNPSKTLNLSGLGLTCLPALSDSVQRLNVSGNHLTYLPEKLPSSLRALDASYNHLTSVPGISPATLKFIHSVDLVDNPLYPQVKAKLSQQFKDPNYYNYGPFIRLRLLTKQEQDALDYSRMW